MSFRPKKRKKKVYCPLLHEPVHNEECLRCSFFMADRCLLKERKGRRFDRRKKISVVPPGGPRTDIRLPWEKYSRGTEEPAMPSGNEDSAFQAPPEAEEISTNTFGANHEVVRSDLLVDRADDPGVIFEEYIDLLRKFKAGIYLDHAPKMIPWMGKLEPENPPFRPEHDPDAEQSGQEVFGYEDRGPDFSLEKPWEDGSHEPPFGPEGGPDMPGGPEDLL